MAFDLSKLKTNFGVAEVSTTSDGRMTTVVQPAPAVAINRPPSQRPVVAPAEALTVTTIEGSAAAHALVEFVDTEGDEVTDPKEAVLVRKDDAVRIVVTSAETTAATAELAEATTHPKAAAGAAAPTTTPVSSTEAPPRARRGRPRKSGVATTATAGADTATVSAVSAPDPKAPAAPAPTASGCAPSVGDLAVAVSALIDAVRALETGGHTGLTLERALEALRGGR